MKRCSTKEEQFAALLAPTPDKFIRKHDQTGMPYVDAAFVRRVLTLVFGLDGWQILRARTMRVYSGTEMAGDPPQPKHEAGYVGEVRLEVRWADGTTTTHEGVGECDQKGKPRGVCHSMAAKGAVSDALKRAARNLGIAADVTLEKMRERQRQ